MRETWPEAASSESFPPPEGVVPDRHRSLPVHRKSIVELNELVQRRGEWLRGTGAESDIVLSSRIRLARNLVQFPFINRADDEVRAEIERTVRSHLPDVSLGGPRTYLEVDHLERLDRQFLVERQLISRELADSHGARAVCFTDEENVSLMVNEEDHLRMQVFHSGFDLDACWQQISRLDDQLEERLPFSFSQELGYLTACPTNAGTGIRVSVLLHLPGLVMTGEEGLHGPAEDQPRGPWTVRRGDAGDGGLLPDLQSDHPGEGRRKADPVDQGRGPEHHRLRAPGAQGVGGRQPGRHPRQDCPRLWNTAFGPGDQFAGDDGPAVERADGGQPGFH
jgi:hypothetical protein